jgi:hypothetical protein
MKRLIPLHVGLVQRSEYPYSSFFMLLPNSVISSTSVFNGFDSQRGESTAAFQDEATPKCFIFNSLHNISYFYLAGEVGFMR